MEMKAYGLLLKTSAECKYTSSCVIEVLSVIELAVSKVKKLSAKHGVTQDME